MLAYEVFAYLHYVPGVYFVLMYCLVCLVPTSVCCLMPSVLILLCRRFQLARLERLVSKQEELLRDYRPPVHVAPLDPELRRKVRRCRQTGGGSACFGLLVACGWVAWLGLAWHDGVVGLDRIELGWIGRGWVVLSCVRLSCVRLDCVGLDWVYVSFCGLCDPPGGGMGPSSRVKLHALR